MKYRMTYSGKAQSQWNIGTWENDIIQLNCYKIFTHSYSRKTKQKNEKERQMEKINHY